MRHLPFTLTLIGVLFGCAQRAPMPAAAQQALRCIALDQVAGRRVAGPSSVLFEMTGPFDYRNDLPAPCPGMARLGTAATISIASGGEGGRLCSGDRIRIMDPVEARATGLASQPSCVLGVFIPSPRAR